MPELRARIKSNLLALGTRDRKNDSQAFEAGVRACLGDAAPLQDAPFGLKLAIIYRAPLTHINYFVSDPETFLRYCGTVQLTENVKRLYTSVLCRLQSDDNDVLKSATKEIASEYTRFREGHMDNSGTSPKSPYDQARADRGSSSTTHPATVKKSTQRHKVSGKLPTTICTGANEKTDNELSSAIAGFCSTMGVTIHGAVSPRSWISVLSAATACSNNEPQRVIPPLGIIAFGNLLRQFEGLRPGEMSIIDPSAAVKSVRVRQQGLGNGLGAVKTEFTRIYKKLFDRRPVPIQPEVRKAWLSDRSLCFLLVAFAAAMDVEPNAPVSVQLWHGLFHQMAQTSVSTSHVLWLGSEVVEHIETTEHISAELSHPDLEIMSKDSLQCASRDMVGFLATQLGFSFVQQLDDDNFVIHQAVLMMLLAAGYSSSTVELCKWPIKVKDLIALIQMAKPSRLVVVLSDSGFDADNSWNDLFEALRFFDGSQMEVSVYPSSSELAWSRHKLGDIRTFDAIAKSEQQWRPQTCFGLGDCSLLSGSQVIKRNYSCAAKDVEIMTTRDQDKLMCTVPSDNDRACGKRSAGGEALGPIYFHQEAVPTLQSFGEFRVFVSAGKVTYILRTRFQWEKPDRPMLAWKARLEDFKWFSSQEAAQARKLAELEQFVLDLDRLIRQKNDEGFESIHIGGRYDCGITEESPKGEFFVNELTRPLSAATFPRTCPFPYTDILRPWAQAVAQIAALPTPPSD
ncbi:hypothetical protein BB8028_0010g00430 [Beauveria bassiana]|uniref:Uncharacterized protein n=1 Tax=Beauveria bassiana TaxID=176275 RepID=A0A2S7YQ20_BEABA|nr:hypothetical protein BB8028_0010g00430 [Beauveria bassiana]